MANTHLDARELILRKLRTLSQLDSRQIVSRLVGKCFGFAAEHHFSDRVLNLPSPIWRLRHPWSRLSDTQGREMIRTLRRDGVAVFPEFFDAAAMERIRQSIAEIFDSPRRVPDLAFRPDERFYATVQALSICPEIAEGAIDPDLLNVVGGYFRRTPFLSETDFRRVVPLNMNEQAAENAKFAAGYTSSHWHHDLRGRQIKVQVYLTDVGPSDQNFAFIKGSHRGFKSSAIAKSRFADEEIEIPGNDVFEVYGKAGTAIVFNSNGIHRLRRADSGIRDSVTYYYHPARMYRAVAHIVHPQALAKSREAYGRITNLAAQSR